MGRLASVDLIKVSRPPCERSWVFHLTSFLLNLSRNGWKNLLFWFMAPISTPKYLEGLEVHLHPRIPLNHILFWRVQLGLTNSFDLLQLIFCPDNQQNSLRICLMALQALTFDLKKTKQSSANNKWLIGRLPLLNLIPSIFLSVLSNVRVELEVGCYKNKESSPIFFKMLSITQNHAPKLRFLRPNLKISFLVCE